MRFDGLEHEVCRFLEDGVDAEVEGVEVWCERVGCDSWVGVEFGEGGREVEGLFGRCGGECVEKSGEEVGVVDAEGNLNEYVLVAKVALLDAKLRR